MLFPRDFRNLKKNAKTGKIPADSNKFKKIRDLLNYWPGRPRFVSTVNLHSSGFEGTSHLYSLLPKFVRAIHIFLTFLTIYRAGKRVLFYSVHHLETLERKMKEK